MTQNYILTNFQAFQEFVVFWTKNGPLKHSDAIQERQERSAKQKYFHFCTDYSHDDDEEFMTIIVSANCIITNKIYQFFKYFLNNQMRNGDWNHCQAPSFWLGDKKPDFPVCYLHLLIGSLSNDDNSLTVSTSSNYTVFKNDLKSLILQLLRE